MTDGRVLRRWIDLLFPPPGPRHRRRPEELLYGLEEPPPPGATIAIGGQHALLALMFSVYAVIAAKSMGMGAHEAAAFTSATIFIIGLGTILQGLRSRFGAGLLLVGIPSPGRMAIHVAVMAQYGLAATMGAAIVAALLAILLARFIPRLRAIFPPEVIGTVVLLLGLSLVVGAATRGLGLAGGQISGAAAAIAGATLATMVAIAVWGAPWLRRLAMAAGAAAGIAMALLLGHAGVDDLALLAEMPLLAVPVLGLDLPWPQFQLLPIAIFLIAELLSMMDQVGSTLSLDRMNDADWRRADMPMVARAVTGLGLTHLLHGLTGTLAGASSSANIGLAHASGITARRVGIAAGLFMVAASFLPPLTGLLAQIPAAVIGGILAYTAAYMIVTGMELIMSRMMNPQRSLTVGLSLGAGTAVMLLPELGRAAPGWAQVMVGSGLVVGSLTAVSLNSLFRIGTARSVRLELPPGTEAAGAARFLDHWGREWGARRDVVLRAATALGEAVETLRQNGVDGPLGLSVGFDEYNLVCGLHYQGEPLEAGGDGAVDPAALLEMEPEEMEAAMRRVSARLLRQLSDHMRSARGADGTVLRLTFHH